MFEFYIKDNNIYNFKMVTNSPEYSRAYYENNKEKYMKNKRIVCDCGMEINRCSKYYHVKTKNNLFLLEQKNKK